MDNLLICAVSTLIKPGRARLRRVAKLCEGYGQRVQFSAVECIANAVQFETFQTCLLQAIDPAEDGLRLPTLHGGREGCVQSHGHGKYADFQAALIV